MTVLKIIAVSLRRGLGVVILLTASGYCYAEALESLVDDFSHPENNSLGIPRQFVNDTVAGGSTSTQQHVSGGVLSVRGDIAPARGQPGWASSVLLLDPEGLPRDASAFEGIRLLVKINKGNLSISANSTEVTNFDYHAAQVLVTADGKFHEVKIPFTSMQRAWSEQTPLNTSTIASLSLVAFDVQKGSCDFAVDEVAFY